MVTLIPRILFWSNHKLNKLYHGPDHLSQIEFGEVDGPIDDQLPDATIFKLESIPYHSEDIALFLTI